MVTSNRFVVFDKAFILRLYKWWRPSLRKPHQQSLATLPLCAPQTIEILRVDDVEHFQDSSRLPQKKSQVKESKGWQRDGKKSVKINDSTSVRLRRKGLSRKKSNVQDQKCLQFHHLSQEEPRGRGVNMTNIAYVCNHNIVGHGCRSWSRAIWLPARGSLKRSTSNFFPSTIRKETGEMVPGAPVMCERQIDHKCDDDDVATWRPVPVKMRLLKWKVETRGCSVIVVGFEVNSTGYQRVQRTGYDL